MNTKVLVAGATGMLGREVVAALKSEGAWVRAISRSGEKAASLRTAVDDVRIADAQNPETLQGACDGVDYVISALGASVSSAFGDRAPYSAVDAVANRNLLAEAKRAGVKKFVYVSVFVQPGYAQTRYIAAHEAFVGDLKASGISYTVVRPTGFFTAMDEFLAMARNGVFPLLDGGTAKSNPIHNADLAQVCIAALFSGEAEIACGGPDILTRKQIGELAFASLGKTPRFVWVPAVLMRWMSRVVRPVHPRMGELMEFIAGVSVTDCVAPVRGTKRLADYFASAGKTLRFTH